MDMINTGLFISDEGLYDYAASTARLLRPTQIASGHSGAKLLRRHLGDIRRTHEAVRRRYGSLPKPPAACEWLLDNYYMVQREYAATCSALSQAKRLRLCDEGLLILCLCRSLVESGQGRVTEERCKRFLDGFQSVTVLRRSELDLFPAALRAAVIAEIASVCRKLPFAAETETHAAALEALFGTLRLFSVLDTEKLLRGVDVTGAILSADPSGDYPRMDRETQQAYLRQVERLAARLGMEEHSYARRLIKTAKVEARHVGFYLFEEKKHRGAALYIAANLLLSLFFSLLPAFVYHSAAAAFLLLLPVSELVKALLDFLLLHLVPPRRLPRMDMEKGVPAEGRTLCVVSALLTDPETASAQASRLEQLRLASRREGKNLSFGLLADLPAAGSAHTEEDAPILSAACRAVEDLNRKYGGGFYLFTRERSFDGELWSGQDRKRGALLELARLLCGRSSALHFTGNRTQLAGTRYILTLDSDTRLYPGAAGELIGAMLHPLAKPHIDPKKRVVTRGCAVLQPRMDTELASANSTDFALIFAGAGGSDPYGGLCSELYMDAFGSSGFAGKGILDVRALLQCSEAHIPAGRVLSHDALEGACLHGGFLGDVSFSDTFPAKPLAYYRRMHRWVRGDWQNLPWVFCRDFSPIDRWRLFDNLRRSLLSPMTLLAIMAGFFLPGSGLAVSAGAALLALLSRLLISLAEGGLRQRQSIRLRRYTRLLTGVGGAIVQTFIRLWLLPYEAWICLSAIVLALWRMLVSHRHLLQWQTAAQSEQSGSGLSAHLKAMWQSMLLGLLLLLFSPVIIGRSAGLLWLLAPLTAAALALPAHRDTPLSAAERSFLCAAAGESLRYYLSFCTSEDNYLPPDNFQEQPPVGLAHRTSPTNIGMALCSFMAAVDLELLPARDALTAVARMLDSLERMPRHRGHFYNWYDTRSLLPLSPAFISTVDSGNLYASLLTVQQALEELNETELARRTEALMAPMDFSPLYDPDRALFYICYDTEAEHGAGGWYDLMASEAMLTSYLAIAKGDVPEKHWRRLSRAQLQKDGYRGLASWTGTMFEYLMPALFLPLCRGSLLYESSRFCLYVQKRRVFAGKPWGISESAFFALDPMLSYRYKANGCSALSLKRGQDADMVVSPYSSFLALAVDAHGAVRNLRRLERFGAVGRFGYMEALDFSPSRCRRDEGEKVQCYMAHHVGMSILAAANAVCGGSIQRRFFSRSDMAAYALLLQERLPDSGAVIRRDLRPVPEKPERRFGDRWQLRGGPQDQTERACLLSNGAYNIMSTNRGDCFARCGQLSVYGSPRDLEQDEGLRLSLETGEKSFPLAPVPQPQGWELSEDACTWEADADGTKCSLSVCAAAGALGELRSIRLIPAKAGTFSLRLDLSPILSDYNDYVNHPAYWRLGIAAKREKNALLLRRLRRGEHKELWLCLACDRDVVFETAPGGETGLPDPRISARVKLSLAAGQTETARFSLCVGWDAKTALDDARRILASPQRGSLVSAVATHLDLPPSEIGEAMAMLPSLLRPLYGAPPRRELWPYGISGDHPLICCEAKAAEALPLLRRFCLLKSCGLEADLVYLTDELGEYRQPFHRQIGDALAVLGLDALLGSSAGVHFVPPSAGETVKGLAALCIGELPRVSRPLRLPILGQPRGKGTAPEYRWHGSEFEYYVNLSLPSRAWQQMLSNGSLGAIVSDCGMSGLWLENAREMRLIPPDTDARSTQGAELLWLEADGQNVSLFAANDGFPCRVHYGPGYACWEKEIAGRQIRTRVFIPMNTNVRILVVEGAAGLPLHWCLRPLLGAADAASLRVSFSGGLFRAENPEAYLPGTTLLAAANCPSTCRTAFTPPAMDLQLTARETSILVCGSCSESELKELCKLDRAMEAFAETRRYWASLLCRLQISSGDGAMDHYLNGWAAYQAVACRLWGRSSLYQSGGAIGFRDQLQDAVNLLLLDPGFARRQILDCCRHQYVEGDVMHWWHPHPEGDRGIRSRCSDDLLWLPWALCEYVDATGDLALCEEEISYVNSMPLADDEWDRYERPEISEASASVLYHAKAALDRCMDRGFGPHDLPYMGSGDWNDGLDAAGGESVWLAWFLTYCAGRFASLLEKLCKPNTQRYRDCADRAAQAAERAWNGRWYRRAYRSDGSPLGGEERIDLLPQAWAVFCGEEAAHADAALDAALERLVDGEHGLIRLFGPPFGQDEPYPGYIAGYGEGFRENGGQYTHGAIWLAMACLRRGRRAEGLRLLRMLLPENHDPARYEAEPFVLAADVYTAPGCEGMAGWTWYTGSAGWYFRAVTRELLGLELRNGRLYIHPRLEHYNARWTDPQGTEHAIAVDGTAITVDGSPYDGGPIPPEHNMKSL